MGFRKDAYATVWSVEGISNTMTKARISVSRKSRETGNYETDFSGFVSFIGTNVANNALSLKERDRIRLGDVDVTTRYDKDQQKEYINYKVFSFTMADETPSNTSGAALSVADAVKSVDDDEDEPLPF